MPQQRVVIPKEDLAVVKFIQDDLPGVAMINVALRGFDPKIVFPWHLSIMVQLNDLVENGMPSRDERDVVDAFGDALDVAIQGEDSQKPNALYLARITWNGTRELIWRVYDPEIANDYLQSILNADGEVRPRPFDFRMDHDPEWELTKWHLQPLV